MQEPMQGIRIGRGARFAALIATRITKRITKRTARITPWQQPSETRFSLREQRWPSR